MSKLKYYSKKQMSEAFLTAGFLSVSGGLQDAYSYLARGKVFANAQTGNIVLLSVNLYEKNWQLAAHYLAPLLAFALGIAAADIQRHAFEKIRKLHWRQLIVLEEILLLFLVGFFPEGRNTIANAIVSFSCAMQVQTFRKVNGYAFASTMCIGNLRSGMESLCVALRLRDKKALHKAGHYFGIILLFAIGAAFGGHFITLYGLHAIWISCGLLFVSFLLMFIREEMDGTERS